MMNSRQRRKLAAEKHNALLIENEAYAQDRIENPEKYRRKRTKSENKRMSAALSALVIYNI